MNKKFKIFKKRNNFLENKNVNFYFKLRYIYIFNILAKI